METRMDGQVVLVTGATQGVGRAIALLAAKSGAAGLVVTGRDVVRGEATVAAIEGAGAKAEFVSAVLDDPAAPDRIVDAALKRFARLDALVNAAAVTDRGGVADASLPFFDRLYAVNVRAPFFLMQRFINHLRARRAPGAIVNILSINAHGGSPALGVYASTKAALALLTRNAAYSHRFDRIRANGINLGWTDTPGERQMQAVTLGKGEGWLKAANDAQPFGRLFTPEDVARLALFLLSDASFPMTGAVIDQDQSVLGVRD
jgi:NAD(P)-dependent dehydrogenase (short-subunit alcohol dehydrogenase family)